MNWLTTMRPRSFLQGSMASRGWGEVPAVQMSVFVVRAFVRLREMLATNWRLAAKINELDSRLDTHDTAIQDIIEAIRELMAPKETPRRKVGFQLPAAKP